MENWRYNSTNFNGGSRWKVCSQPYPRQKAHGIYWPGTVGGVDGLEFIHSLVFSLEGRLGRNQSLVM